MVKSEQVWKRERAAYPNEGYANPDYTVEARTIYYHGPNGGRIAVTYYVREWSADETNLPQDDLEALGYPLNEDGERVLYSVDELIAYIPGMEPPDEAERWEEGEGCGLWYWTLDSAIKRMEEMAAWDEGEYFHWDGLRESLPR